MITDHLRVHLASWHPLAELPGLFELVIGVPLVQEEFVENVLHMLKAEPLKAHVSVLTSH